MHKKVKLEQGYNYTGTTVPFSRSVGQIKDLLTSHGVLKIAEMTDFNTEGEQISTIAFEHFGIPYVIEFPITYVKYVKKPDALNMNISGRIVFDRIKALLIQVDIEYLSFSQAMMPFIAIPSETGTMGVKPLEESILENDEQLKSGRFDMRLCLPGSGGND